MNKALTLMAAAFVATCALAEGLPLPWVGTEIVFGENYRDTVNELVEPAEASAVRFDAPATLFGETLTMVSPAIITGAKGAVLNPLAGEVGLQVGPDYETMTYFGDKTAKLLWRNLKLADVSGVSGYMCGSWGGGDKTVPDYIFFTKASDGSMATAQFQAWQINQWTRTVLITLVQDGDDVYATLEWAKYSSEKSSNGKDWLLNPSAAEAGTHGEYTTYPSTPTANGCGVMEVTPVLSNEITLSGEFPNGTVNANLDRLVIKPQRNLVIDQAFSGRAREVVYRNTPGEWQTYRQENTWVGKDEVLIAEEGSISSIEVTGAYFCGKAVNADAYSNPALLENFGTWSEVSGAVRSMQLQYHDYGGPDNDWTKAVNVEFRQDGGKIYMKVISTNFQHGDVRGKHITENPNTVPCTDGDPNNRGGCNGNYGINCIALRFRSGFNCVTFAGSSQNTMAGGTRFVLDCIGETSCANASAFPNRCTLVLTNGTFMTLEAQTTAGMFGSNSEIGKPFYYEINEGCELLATRDWQIGAYAHVDALGGQVIIGAASYVNWLTLADGGSLERRGNSSYVRVGYYAGDTYVKTLPGGDCTIDAELIGIKRNYSGYENFHCFDLGADLHLKRPILDTLESNMFGLNWRKTGPAALLMETNASTATLPNNTEITRGVFDIKEGTVACRNDFVLSASTPILLNGGALDAGSYENSFGVLTVAADSSIVLDNGCKVAFGDSSAVEWTGDLLVCGPGSELAAQAVRFGDSAAALTAEQLRHVRYNGMKCRVELDANGYLVAKPIGTVLLIK